MASKLAADVKDVLADILRHLRDGTKPTAEDGLHEKVAALAGDTEADVPVSESASDQGSESASESAS